MTDSLGRCFDIGERMIKHTGELYELQPAEQAGHVHWVRINTDQQAAEAVQNVRDRLREINEGAE